MQITRIVLIALALAGSTLAQQSSGSRSIAWPDIGVFGGYQGWDLWRSKFKSQPGAELVPGGVGGVRLGWDLTKNFGLEGAYTMGVNNLRAFPDQTAIAGQVRPSQLGFGGRNRHLSLNPIWHFAGPDARLRPYVTAGLGAISFRPTSDAKRDAGLPTNAIYGAQALKADLMPAFNWGGGLKYNLTQLLQLRFDARNIITRQPHFGLSRIPVMPGAAFASPNGVAGGLQATAGLGFNLGGLGGCCGGGSGSTGADSGSRASRFAGKALRVDLSGGKSPIALGESTSLKATTDAPDATKVKYLWTVNGQGTDVTGPEFVFNSRGRSPGDYKICLSATTTSKGFDPGSECYTVTVLAPSALDVKISDPVTINAGQTANLTATTNAPAGAIAGWEWTVGGQPVTAQGPNYAFNSESRQPGKYEVCAAATVDGFQPNRACTAVTVNACTNPMITLGLTGGTEVFAGERVSIPATAQPGSCQTPVKISFRASDGAITGDAAGTSATGALDTANVAFDRTNRSKLQRKNVVVTATATDDRGNATTAQTTVVVKLAPEAQRLDDVLFAAGNARVNNCGKRVLLEMLAPRLRDDPEARVVLVGHIDEGENGGARKNGKRKGKGKAAAAATRQLDKARVLNAAAVISAGAGICPTLELSRVKVAFAGKSQGSETRPTFCGGSTEPRAVKGARARADKRAQYRRVEVWIVPAGAALPPGVSVQDVPAAEVKALKCPK